MSNKLCANVNRAFLDKLRSVKCPNLCNDVELRIVGLSSFASSLVHDDRRFCISLEAPCQLLWSGT